jgi:hypothetical protein
MLTWYTKNKVKNYKPLEFDAVHKLLILQIRILIITPIDSREKVSQC